MQVQGVMQQMASEVRLVTQVPPAVQEIQVPMVQLVQVARAARLETRVL